MTRKQEYRSAVDQATRTLGLEFISGCCKQNGERGQFKVHRPCYI
jgi:hypothetical protein